MNLEYAKILWKHTVQNQGLTEEQLLTIGFEDGFTAGTRHASLIIMAAKDLLETLYKMQDVLGTVYAKNMIEIEKIKLQIRVSEYEKANQSTN